MHDLHIGQFIGLVIAIVGGGAMYIWHTISTLKEELKDTERLNASHAMRVNDLEKEVHLAKVRMNQKDACITDLKGYMYKLEESLKSAEAEEYANKEENEELKQRLSVLKFIHRR